MMDDKTLQSVKEIALLAKERGILSLPDTKIVDAFLTLISEIERLRAENEELRKRGSHG